MQPMLLTLDCTDVTRAIEDVESKCIDVEVNVGVEGSIGNILVTSLKQFFQSMATDWYCLVTTCTCSGKSTQLSEFTVIGLVCC